MKANKKGISLIVLVITIIVIIILAAAVILTINNNNPMDNANKAKYSSDRATMQQAFTTAVGTVMGKQLTAPKFLNPTDGSEITDQLYYEIGSDGGAAADNLVKYATGNVKGNIVFDTTVPSSATNDCAVGYSLPRYGTGAGKGRWFINKAGDIRLVVDKKVYDGSNSGTAITEDSVKNSFASGITF